MLKVIHLFDHNKGSRFHLMINHGLIEHKNVELWVNQDVISLGKVIYPQSEITRQVLLEADLIFRAGDEHFIPSSNFYDRNDLWSKTVYYDFSDNDFINQTRLNQCKLYVKRVLDKRVSGVLQLDYCLMPEYVSHETKARYHDIIYPILYKPDGHNEDMRNRVNQILTQAFDPSGKSIIGMTTLSKDENGRRAIFDYFTSGNPFYHYMEILETSKMVWTCGPDHAGGDNRLWEAFGSGAMVITDDGARRYGFIDGYHCQMYNLSNINEIVEQVRWFLSTDNWEEKSTVSRLAGQAFALSRHSPINRIQKVLDAIN